MMLTLVLLLFSLCYEEADSAHYQEPFVLNRVRIMKNTAKQVSVRFHASSPELILLHSVLRFSSPINQHHNALLIDMNSVNKYRKIMSESAHKMTITSRTVKKVLSYHTVQDNATSDANNDGINDKLYEVIRSVALFGLGLGATTSYDGILLLDEYSAIWNDYNVMIFSEALLTFEYVVNGALSIQGETQVAEFSGVTQFSCDPTFDSDHCLVLSRGGIEVNGHHYPTYRVVVDLDSSENFLPIDLYLMWHTETHHPGVDLLAVTLGDGQVLYLNSKFHYTMHQSNILILGIDVIHNFPRVEYSMARKSFQLWYYQSTLTQLETHQMVETLFVFLNLILLACLFVWGTSYNYQILHYMIRFGNFAKTAHFFAYKQVIIEVLAMVVGLILIIVSLAVSEPAPTWTAYENRKVLFIGFLIYHMVMNIVVLLVYVEPNRCVLRHYFSRLYGLLEARRNRHAVLITPLVPVPENEETLDPIAYLGTKASMTTMRARNRRALAKASTLSADACTTTPSTRDTNLVATEPVMAIVETPLPYREAFVDIADPVLANELHCTVVKMYHDPVIKLYTPISIIRNLAFITILLTSLELLFNFYSAMNNTYLLLIVGLSFGLIYYQVKYLAVSIVYLSLFYPCPTPPSYQRANEWFVLFLLSEAAVVVLYIVLSYESIYVTYFNMVNSSHSAATISAYVICVIATLVMIAVMMVMVAFDKYADPILEDAIELHQQRRATAIKTA